MSKMHFKIHLSFSGMKRNCYCKPEQKYCGDCSVCGKKGHISHYPGEVPATGSWCDTCYEKEARNWIERQNKCSLCQEKNHKTWQHKCSICGALGLHRGIDHKINHKINH